MRDRYWELFGIQFGVYVVILLILAIRFDHFSPNLFEWWSLPPCRETLKACLLLFPLGFAIWYGGVRLENR